MSQLDPNQALREEFNRWAETGLGEGLEEDHLPIVLPVLDQMKLARDDNVLDVGCGAGWLARLIAERVPEGRVVGMDIADEMVRRARRNYLAVENAMFVIGGVDEIPWDANFFSHAISVESAYYWPEPARGLREIHRVMREGGSAWILINYYLENVHSHHFAELFATPTHLLSAEGWEALFREAGFHSIHHRQIPDPTPVPESFKDEWFRDADHLRAFRKTGALLVHGTK
ncbi:MAG TPA: class I SAM-dependent methyltransferase [Candidatus Acidoferrales bacterium]|nr:class I SAM-dependent methyltransferase [Candidatus Acidoferrales bacterium]